MVDRLKIEQCVESLCQNGCAAVYATITAMEKNLDGVPLPGLSTEEKQMVLQELQAIMSVYDQPCDIRQQASR